MTGMRPSPAWLSAGLFSGLPAGLRAGLLAALLGTSSVLAQQVCATDQVIASSPVSRFADQGDGTVTDTLTQLMWMRCAVGQVWRDNACSGPALRLSWPEATAQAQQVNQSGSQFFDDWRVPSLRELATVTERRCSHPRTNLELFPGTPAAPFWTSTRKVTGGETVYVLDFAAGAVDYDDRSAQHHVRLVRQTH